MAGSARQRGDATHEGAAYAEYVNVHALKRALMRGAEYGEERQLFGQHLAEGQQQAEAEPTLERGAQNVSDRDQRPDQYRNRRDIDRDLPEGILGIARDEPYRDRGREDS